MTLKQINLCKTQRKTTRWTSFKERCPRIKTLIDGLKFSPYILVPEIAMYLAAKPELLEYVGINKSDIPKPPELFILGTSILLTSIVPLVRAIHNIRKKKHMDPKEKFILTTLAGEAPTYVTGALVFRTITKSLTENYIPSLFIPSLAAVCVFYGVWGPLWHISNRLHFDKVKKKTSKWERFKEGFADGFRETPVFMAMEKIFPNTRIVKKIDEMHKQRKESLKVKNSAGEDALEYWGISEGTRLPLYFLRFGFMGSVLSFGLSGTEAFLAYFALMSPVELSYEAYRATVGSGLFKPRIDEKVT
ncbi:MAG: hypothetical protein WC501_03305 [Candidatus Micrarchaeia archaeon]|jgi:hypothetical protein